MQLARLRDNLSRVFARLNKKSDGKIDVDELWTHLKFLGYKCKRAECEDMIWEVDEDCDHCVSWDEFKLMFHRCRNDRTGLEPRKLFNVVDFLMLDKNHSGAVDMDECVTLLWMRYEKVRILGGSPNAASGHSRRLCRRRLAYLLTADRAHPARDRRL